MKKKTDFEKKVGIFQELSSNFWLREILEL